MATVIGKTSVRIDELLAPHLVDAEISNGRLLVTNRAGAVSDLGLMDTPHNHDDRHRKLIEVGSGEGNRRVDNLATWSEAVSGGPGVIVIQTNLSFGNYMCRLNIKGYNYATDDNLHDIDLGFYAFNTGAGEFHGHGAVSKGNSATIGGIRLMRRASDNKVAIILDLQSSYAWQYPKFTVDGVFGHTVPPDSQLQGWTITRLTSLAAYVAMTTVRIDHLLPLVPISKVGTSTYRLTNLPNDGAVRQTHYHNFGGPPSGAQQALITMSVNAHCVANAQVAWHPYYVNALGGWEPFPAGGNPVHNHGNPSLNMGATWSVIADVRRWALQGTVMQLQLQASNDAGSGAWLDVGALMISVTYLGSS